MKAVAAQVADGNILRLIEKFLRAGVMENGVFKPPQLPYPIVRFLEPSQNCGKRTKARAPHLSRRFSDFLWFLSILFVFFGHVSRLGLPQQPRRKRRWAAQNERRRKEDEKKVWTSG
jgi:hypothetical protein